MHNDQARILPLDGALVTALKEGSSGWMIKV